MAYQQKKAQAGITLRRVTDGRTVMTAFSVYTLNGSTREAAGLFQIVSSDDGSVAPDWGANPVYVEPVVKANGETLTLYTNQAEWYYNGVKLTFGSNKACTNYPGKFRLHTDGLTLILCGNAASPANTDSDTITFKGLAKAGASSDISVEHTRDIQITETGQNVYKGIVLPQSAFIGGDNGEYVTLCAYLYKGTEQITLNKSMVSWFKGYVSEATRLKYSGTPTGITIGVTLYGGTSISEQSHSTQVTTPAGETIAATSPYIELKVNRKMVDGSALFIAQFHSEIYSTVGGVPSEIWEQAGAYVTDVDDEYMIALSSSEGCEIGDGVSTTVTAQLIRGGSVIADGTLGTVWKLTPLDVETLNAAQGIPAVATSSMTVTADDLDRNGGQLLIIADASW